MSKNEPSIRSPLPSSQVLADRNAQRIEGGMRMHGTFDKKSKPGRPLISVVTVVFNGRDRLEQTILSVLEQPYDNIEYIIIDGWSADGTREIISKYDEKISYWLSEPDRGVYDAMNKAIRLMTGAGHIFLNAGDYFVSDIFGESPAIPSFLPVYYERLFVGMRKVAIKSCKIGLPNCHQGIIFETKGIAYNTVYRFAADYQYYLDHGYRDDLRFNACPGHVYYDNSGLSMVNAKTRDQEMAAIIKHVFGAYSYLYFIARTAIKDIVKNIAAMWSAIRKSES